MKKQKRIYKRTIKIPIYSNSFDIVIGKNYDQMNEYYGKRTDDNREMQGAFFRTPPTFLISLDVSINTIAHEMIHVLHAYTDHIGMPLTDSSQEAYAYLGGFLMEEIMTHIEKAKKHYKGSK